MIFPSGIKYQSLSRKGVRNLAIKNVLRVGVSGEFWESSSHQSGVLCCLFVKT